ncbi:MAG: rhodanese-like domain-containing protein [Phycisphaerales bacterium]|nr:rhodanese-like domain-containing protein [Phycisphaerales bacterium]
MNVDFGRDIGMPDYISSEKGSSLADLKKLADALDVTFDAVSGIPVSQLRKFRHPTILHVRGSPETGYNHYVLLVGLIGDDAVLIDGSERQILPINDLARKWNGTALTVSSIGRKVEFSPVNLPVLLGCAALLCVAISFKLLGFGKRAMQGEKFHKLMRTAGFQGIALGAIGFGWGTFYNAFINDAGLLSDGKAVSALERQYEMKLIPKISLTKLQKHIRNGCFIVDARLAPDHLAEHIPGSVSLPVNATEKEIETFSLAVPRRTPIVVYCQSSGCPYAQKVAEKLKERGYKEVRVSKIGWLEWQAATPPPKPVN